MSIPSASVVVPNPSPSPAKPNEEGQLHDVALAGEIDDGLGTNTVSLDERFTRKQLAMMNEQKEDYMESTKKQKQHLTRSIADKFIEEILETGAQLNSTQRKRITQNVQYWFSQKCRIRREVPRFFHPYCGRQVFYKENSELVAHRQQRLFAQATGRPVEESDSDEEPEDIDEIDPVDDAPILKAKPNGKPFKLFDFLQAAITQEYDKLSDEERADYDRKAVEWRTQGPAEEVKRSRAEKDLGRYLLQFADELYKQMGVKLYFFVSYMNTKGQHVTLQQDFGKSLYGAKKDFREIARPIISKSGAFGRWNEYTKEEHSAKDSEEKREGGKDGPLYPLPLNEYLEPEIPHWDQKYYSKDLPQFEYLQKVVRCVVSHCHALAMGSPIENYKPTEETRFPWKKIGGTLFSYAKRECFPEGVERISDPSAMGKAMCQSLVRHWFERQEQGLVPLEFHSYFKKGVKNPIARVPRTPHNPTEEAVRRSQRQQTRGNTLQEEDSTEDSLPEEDEETEEETPKRKNRGSAKRKTPAKGTSARKGKVRKGVRQKEPRHESEEVPEESMAERYPKSSSEEHSVSRESSYERELSSEPKTPSISRRPRTKRLAIISPSSAHGSDDTMSPVLPGDFDNIFSAENPDDHHNSMTPRRIPTPPMQHRSPAAPPALSLSESLPDAEPPAFYLSETPPDAAPRDLHGAPQSVPGASWRGILQHQQTPSRVLAESLNKVRLDSSPERLPASNPGNSSYPTPNSSRPSPIVRASANDRNESSKELGGNVDVLPVVDGSGRKRGKMKSRPSRAERKGKGQDGKKIVRRDDGDSTPEDSGSDGVAEESHRGRRSGEADVPQRVKSSNGRTRSRTLPPDPKGKRRAVGDHSAASTAKGGSNSRVSDFTPGKRKTSEAPSKKRAGEVEDRDGSPRKKSKSADDLALEEAQSISAAASPSKRARKAVTKELTWRTK
ncbi:hypothetical protein NMY22_g8248 [Coprinellus aureogranulatus]|nr:hypothetical protein NMY22_g8248 [Coprinellus aureogranulatus]